MNLDYLFNTLLKEINLPITSEEEFIRIEKTIRLNKKINQQIDENEAEAIIQLLKNHEEEICLLASDKNLVNFLLKKTFFASKSELLSNPQQLAKLKPIIDLYFEDNFKDSISYYITSNKFSELNILFEYNEILNESIRNFIQEKAKSKLDFAYKFLLKTTKNTLSVRDIYYLKNKNFFLLLSYSYTYLFDDMLIDITNLVIKNLNASKVEPVQEFYTQYLSNLKYYESKNEDLNERMKSLSQNVRNQLSKSTSTQSDTGSIVSLLIFVLIIVIKGFDSSDSNNDLSYISDTSIYNIEGKDFEYVYSVLDILSNNILKNKPIDSTEMSIFNSINHNHLLLCLGEPTYFPLNLDTPNYGPIIFLNNTDKTILIYLSRHTKYKNSILEVNPKSSVKDTLLFHENFRIFTSNNDSSDYSTTNFKKEEAKLLKKQFEFNESKTDAIPYFKIDYINNKYITEFSDNIKIIKEKHVEEEILIH